MKNILLILVLVFTTTCQSGNKVTTQDMLEASLPKIWQNLHEIYIFEGKEIIELKIKEAPLSKDVCRTLGISEEDAPMCSYLFDSEGNKTPYFLALSKNVIGVDSVTMVTKVKIGGVATPEYEETTTLGVDKMMNDSAGLLFTWVCCEVKDNRGKYQIKRVGAISGMGKRVFRFIKNIETKTSIDRILSENEYQLNLDKKQTTLFLNPLSDSISGREYDNSHYEIKLIERLFPYED